MASKWVRTESGALVSLDKIESITVNSTQDGAEVRAYPPGDPEVVGYYVLFSHADRAICEEWRDTFAQEHLDVLPRVVLWRKCPECNGTGRMPSPDPHSTEPCPFCEGECSVTLEAYEKYMAEFGMAP